jgi:sulfatase modifying factor 1
VGTFDDGVGVWGQLDLAGNVEEVTLDWYATYVVPCDDCANTSPEMPDTSFYGHVTRSGSFNYGSTNILSSYTTWKDPAARLPELGFRCARAP